MKIFITGTVGESLPAPYAGIPKHSLLLARLWREKDHQVALSWVYRHDKEDDLGAQGTYFFEFNKKPNKVSKILFLIKYFISDPALYIFLFQRYLRTGGPMTREVYLYAAYGVFLDKAMQSFRPDVIMAEAALIKGFMAAEVAKRRKIPVSVHVYAEVHDMTMGANKFLKGDEQKLEKYWKTFFETTDLILSPSIYCSNASRKYFPQEKIKVIYFGIDISKGIEFNETQESARNYFKLPHDVFFFVAVGALTLRKGHDHMIRAAAKLIKKGEKVGVLICGPGNPAELKAIAAEEGISDKVFFFTGLSETELMRLYRAANVYCDASNTPRACLGMSLTEGMVMGLPAVAYDAGGMPEVVLPMKNGLLAPTNDINALSEQLHEISTMPHEQYVAFGEEGKKLARDLVDIKKEAARLIEEFEKIVR
jgi:glycosyltransferase involved in cell wall biosynthesis